jgi:UDP-N-acetylmuramyl tripeptide synthase
VLDVPAAAPEQLAQWRGRVQAMRAALGWQDDGAIVALAHADGAALAIAAPRQRLFAATELNEWAWQGAALAALQLPLPAAPGHPATLDFDSALETLRRLEAAERRPALDALVAEAIARGLPVYEDDEAVTIGGGKFGRTWSLEEIARGSAAIDLSALASIPTALVTGSNGKTTTVRLLAAMCVEAGLVPGYNCTDGVFVGGESLEQGDWSGPAGARSVLRDPRVEAAILETARGGLLRRGLAVAHADAAIVTNISADHFGEYGVHSLEQLAAAKLVVARALGAGGVLVLNADDAAIAAEVDGGFETGVDKFPVGRSPVDKFPVDEASPRAFAISWFSLDENNPRLAAARTAGAATCTVSQGVLMLYADGAVHALGAVAQMPLSLGGVASYNIANAAGAALLAHALGIAPAHVATVLARFGASNADNPGRLQRWQHQGVEILLDYAHNPDGLRGLLAIARGLAGRDGRLGLLLGQAGNREDEAIRELARTAAAARPERVVLKDLPGFLRGRGPGEVPALLLEELRRCGMEDERLHVLLAEAEAARSLLAWARRGDVLVLPVHGPEARAQLMALLDSIGQPANAH